MVGSGFRYQEDTYGVKSGGTRDEWSVPTVTVEFVRTFNMGCDSP